MEKNKFIRQTDGSEIHKPPNVALIAIGGLIGVSFLAAFLAGGLEQTRIATVAFCFGLFFAFVFCCRIVWTSASAEVAKDQIETAARKFNIPMQQPKDEEQRQARSQRGPAHIAACPYCGCSIRIPVDKVHVGVVIKGKCPYCLRLFEVEGRQ